MDSLASGVLLFFGWLVRTTCQASLLIVLILVIQRVLGRRLGVRGRHWLWLVVLLRMALPWAIPSRVSLYNLLPVSSLQGRTPFSASVATRARLATARGGAVAKASEPAASGARSASDGSSARRGSWLERHGTGAEAIILLAGVWLAGVCLLMGGILRSAIRLRRLVRQGRPVADPWILDLLEECKRLMGTRGDVGVIASEQIAGPALCGSRRPRLLLPGPALAGMDRSELRHIFLHELAHLRRHDILIGYLAGFLHILHWFNPLIALGLRRMQMDRELACDGLVLSLLSPEETSAYGYTIVRQIERRLASPWRSVLPGLCGDRAQVQRRIAAIASFRKETRRRSLLAAGLVGSLAVVGLTDALAASLSWDEYARRDFPTTQQDKHANIQRCCLRNLETGKYLAVDGERVTCDADEPGEAGLWEFRFDEVSNIAESVVYFYSVPACKYLTVDQQGNLAVNAREPVVAAGWGTYPRPQGVWLISHHFQDGYLRLDEQGSARAVNFGRDARSYWDVHSVWRIKTSDNPKSNPQWQREKIPGPD